MKVKAR